MLGALALVPFAQVVTLPVFLVVGAVFLVLKLTNNLPRRESMLALEKQLDDVSFRAFAVAPLAATS